MYDNADTFKLKAEFACGQCLGGVIVWAVSYNLPYSNYSSTLGEVANYKVKVLAMSTMIDKLETCKVHQQCKWINYFKNCPTSWTLIACSNSSARKGEGMLDNTSCG
jgi:GH18 family chitinase